MEGTHSKVWVPLRAVINTHFLRAEIMGEATNRSGPEGYVGLGWVKSSPIPSRPGADPVVKLARHQPTCSSYAVALGQIRLQ